MRCLQLGGAGEGVQGDCDIAIGAAGEVGFGGCQCWYWKGGGGSVVEDFLLGSVDGGNGERGERGEGCEGCEGSGNGEGDDGSEGDEDGENREGGGEGVGEGNEGPEKLGLRVLEVNLLGVIYCKFFFLFFLFGFTSWKVGCYTCLLAGFHSADGWMGVWMSELLCGTMYELDWMYILPHWITETERKC